MDPASTLGRTIATLTAVAELLDDDGNLAVTMPPLRVELRTDTLDQTVTFTANGILDNPRSYKGLLVPVTVHLPDHDDIDVTVDVSHGSAIPILHDDRDVEAVLDAITDLIGNASDGGIATDLHRWFTARSTLTRLSADLQHAVDVDRLRAAVQMVAPHTAAGALADDWHGDLPSLATAARALQMDAAPAGTGTVATPTRTPS